MNEVFSLECCLWIPNSKFYLEVPLLYIVYCPLARGDAVSINTAYKIGCCNWTLIQLCTEVVMNINIIIIIGIVIITTIIIFIMQYVNQSSWTHDIIFYISVNVQYLLLVQYLLSINSGIVDHGRCNISHISIFSFKFSYRGIFL